MSTLSIATIQSLSSTTDLTVKSANSTAGAMVVKADGSAVIIQSNSSANAFVANTSTTILQVNSANAVVANSTSTLLTSGATTLLTANTTGITSAGIVADSVGTIRPLVSMSVANTATSNAYYDFTGIPSWVKRVTIMFNNVSTTGTSHKLVQLGSTTFSNTGYTSTFGYHITGTGAATATAGFGIYTVAATDNFSGTVDILTLGSNVWVYKVGGSYGAGTLSGGGNITLGGILDRIRITTVNGTDTFDAGSVNVMYE